jgi:hypothetical protein
MNSPQLLAEKIVGPNLQNEADTQLHGHKLMLARTAWVIVALIAVALWVAYVPLRFAELQTVCAITSCPDQIATPDMVQALQGVGLSIHFYAIYTITIEIVFVLMFLGIAAIIAWRKSHNWMALLVSLDLVTSGTFFVIEHQLLITAYPITQLPYDFVRLLVTAILVLFCYLFPDGRFVPRWTCWFAILVIIFLGMSAFFPNSLFDIYNWPNPLGAVVQLAVVGTMLFAQVYRYLRVSTPSQRQQTKWIIFGIIATIIYFLALIILAANNPSSQRAGSLGFLFASTSFYLAGLIIPLAIAFSMLRYRLWDIDLLINRTLVYGTLTGILALIYFGCVIILQNLVRGFTGQVGQSPLVIVGSTLAIAALFQPLRRRIQRIIDRRFYRHKYDATRILAAFSATLRNDVELSQLSEQLVAVVQETMQPAHISLWLRHPEPSQERYTRLLPRIDEGESIVP